jgi:hypothetical protein
VANGTFTKAAQATAITAAAATGDAFMAIIVLASVAVTAFLRIGHLAAIVARDTLPFFQSHISALGVISGQDCVNDQKGFRQASFFEGLMQGTEGIPHTELTLTDVRMSDLIIEFGRVGLFRNDFQAIQRRILGPSCPVQPNTEMPEFNIAQENGLRLNDELRFLPIDPNNNKLLFELQEVLIEVT